MSDIGTMVDLLIAAGTPPGLAAQIVAQAFASGVASADFRGQSADEQAARRREKDRIRQAERRERQRISADNPQTSADVTNASLSKEEDKKEIKEERGERKRDVRGQRLPDDWQPTAQDLVTAHELVGQPNVAAELEKFRDHWKQQPGSKGVKLDWNAAWRNWIRRAAEYRGGMNGNRNHATARGSASADFFAGMRSVAEDIPGHGAAPGPADPPIPRGRVEIDG